MKKVYFISAMLLNLIFSNIHAQTFDWAKTEGLWAYDYGYGITNDNTGNVYVAGKYEMNADFSSTILPCQGNHDIYLAKYSSAGALSWITTAGGTLGDYAHALDCDGSKYLYTAGEIEGLNETIVFQNSPINLHSVGGNDIFVSKYDLSGNLLWARSAGAYQDDKALGVTHDNSGNVYICGFFNDTAIFGGTTTIYGSGLNDIFVAKYDSLGNFLWVQHAGSSGRDEAKSIKCDAAGNVYVCGMYTGTASFGATTLTSIGNFDIFLAKYSSGGALIWVKSAGDAWNDVAWSLTLDNAGKIYIGGECAGYVAFDNIHIGTSGGYGSDAFVACYDASGNAQWAVPAGSTLDDRARGIGCDGTNLYITGQFGSTASFGSYTVTAADSSDIFVAKLNTSGTFLWAIAVGGVADSVETLGYESGNTVCADQSGYVYASGSLLNGGIFGSTTLSPYKRTDVFITRLSQVGAGIQAIIDVPKNIRMYPNPTTGNFTLDLAQLGDQKIDISVFNYVGQTIDKRTHRTTADLNIDLSDKENGIYFIEIKTGQATYRQKIIID